MTESTPSPGENPPTVLRRPDSRRSRDLRSGPERPDRTQAETVGRLTTVEEPFASNPFRVLRLPAGVPGRQIRETIEQARIEARLGSNPEVESRLNALTKAQAELLDPSKRVHLWFYDPPAGLFDGSLEETNQALARFRAGSESKGDSRTAHDLALWLLVEAAHSLDPAATEDWTVRALSAWRDVSHDPTYLRSLTGSKTSHGRTAEAIWALGLGVLATSSRRCMNTGDLDGVLSRYRGAKSFGLEESDLIKVIEPAIEIAVLEGQRKVVEARAESEEVGRKPVEARSWADRLKNSLSAQVELRAEIADLELRELDKVLDEAADLIRDVAIPVHTDLSATQLACELVEVALKLAVSSKTVERLESDLGTLRGLVAIGPLAEVIYDAATAVQSAHDAVELYEYGSGLYEALVNYEEWEDESATEAVETGLSVLRAIAIRLHNEYGETAEAATVMGWCVELATDDDARATLRVCATTVAERPSSPTKCVTVGALTAASPGLLPGPPAPACSCRGLAPARASKPPALSSGRWASHFPARQPPCRDWFRSQRLMPIS